MTKTENKRAVVLFLKFFWKIFLYSKFLLTLRCIGQKLHHLTGLDVANGIYCKTALCLGAFFTT